MGEGPRCDQCEEHQGDRAKPVGPRRPAEERPPDDDRRGEDHSADHRAESGIEGEPLGLRGSGKDNPDQYQQNGGDDARPEPEGGLRNRLADVLAGHRVCLIAPALAGLRVSTAYT